MNLASALWSAVVTFIIVAIILVVISAVLPGVNIAVLFWSLIAAGVVFVLALFSGNRLGR